MQLPQIIQGGMGAGVSSWTLAHAVSSAGQLGVVSGTALDVIVARRLQVGDPGGHMRRALHAFPYPEIAQRVLKKYFIAEGKASDKPFKSKPLIGHKQPQALQELIVVANFVEVYLAKEGHDGLVGINFLEKIQPPTLPSLYGAMLADVDVIIMGAGIPKYIPGILDKLANNEPVNFKFYVMGANPDHNHRLTFDPKDVLPTLPKSLRRPMFFPIVASVTLASMMVKKSSGRIDGLIIEGPTAGGHNAPPRGKIQLNSKGEPIYGQRDVVDLEGIKALGLPFWLAGSYGSPEKLAQACSTGATGVQIGTLFAFCEESGLTKEFKQYAIKTVREEGQLPIFTDPVASPTGFPFKVLTLEGSNSDATMYEQRDRICDLGYLRDAYEKEDGSLGWRCSSEPEKDYLTKGGAMENTVGRKCLCNGLVANIGLEQVRSDGVRERALLTCGDDATSILQFVPVTDQSYPALSVVDFLLSSVSKPAN